MKTVQSAQRSPRVQSENNKIASENDFLARKHTLGTVTRQKLFAAKEDYLQLDKWAALNRDEQGMSALLIPFILAMVFFLSSLGFALWSYNSRQDYKNNVDGKVATAVEVAKKEEATKKDNEFIEREKQPLQEYKGPVDYGAVDIHYPKTWSAYVDEVNKSTPVNGYFHPHYVPGIQAGQNYALRVQVLDRKFDEALREYDGQVRTGKATISPYKPVNVANVVGEKLEGEIEPRKNGIVVLIPIRDKTIKLSTESDQYKADFNNNILPNFSFTP